MSKIKLSETLKFLTGRFNTITGGDLELSLEVDHGYVKAGEQLSAQAKLRSPDRSRGLNYVMISVTGQVQRDGEWQDFVQTAEVAQEVRLPEDYEYVIPIVVHIPEDAVYTQDGAHWKVSAKASVEKAVDPKAEEAFEVRP